MTQALDAVSGKETHSFSGVYSSDTGPHALILFHPAKDSEQPSCFWKLEQISQPRTSFMPEGSRKSFGRITKVFINQNYSEKVATRWRAARSAINEIYDGMYSVNHRESLIESDHFHYLPAEELEECIVISFVLRYYEDELDDAPQQSMNIDVPGNELPGDLPDGIKLNLRIGHDVAMQESLCYTEDDMTFFGGQAVLTENPTGIQIYEINEAFIIYLLREFGMGRLTFLANSNREHAGHFRDYFKIKKPFGGSCCILM